MAPGSVRAFGPESCYGVSDRSVKNDVPVLKNYAPIANAGYQFKVVADDNKRLAGLGKFLDLIQTLTLKRLIANSQYLVDKENFRIRVHCHRKRKAEVHSGRIEPDLRVNELAYLGKFHD